MPYLIDGHNLIPKVTGLDLQHIDDEKELIQKLQGFARRARKRVEVYFDKAPPGQASSRRYGWVTAIFVREGKTADKAILARLQTLGNEARNWTVVSSDGEVMRRAEGFQAQVITSQAFAEQLSGSSPAVRGKTSLRMNEDEIEYWLDQFENR